MGVVSVLDKVGARCGGVGREIGDDDTIASQRERARAVGCKSHGVFRTRGAVESAGAAALQSSRSYGDAVAESVRAGEDQGACIACWGMLRF